MSPLLVNVLVVRDGLHKTISGKIIVFYTDFQIGFCIWFVPSMLRGLLYGLLYLIHFQWLYTCTRAFIERNYAKTRSFICRRSLGRIVVFISAANVVLSVKKILSSNLEALDPWRGSNLNPILAQSSTYYEPWLWILYHYHQHHLVSTKPYSTNNQIPTSPIRHRR